MSQTAVTAIIVFLFSVSACSKRPPTDRSWDLILEAGDRCLPAEQTIPLQAFVRTGSHSDQFHNTYPEGYTSRDKNAAGNFSWKILSSDDPFWSARRKPPTWLGQASINDRGDFVGSQEGLVGVRVTYEGKTDIRVFTVIPAVHVEIEPTAPVVKVHDWVTFTINAAFSDGRPVPAEPAPQLYPVGDANALMIAGNPSSRGEPYAPWFAYVNAVASGHYKLKFKYLGVERDIDLTAEGVADSKPNPDYVEAARRNGMAPAPKISIEDTVLARRIAAMRDRCVYADNDLP